MLHRHSRKYDRSDTSPRYEDEALVKVFQDSCSLIKTWEDLDRLPYEDKDPRKIQESLDFQIYNRGKSFRLLREAGYALEEISDFEQTAEDALKGIYTPESWGSYVDRYFATPREHTAESYTTPERSIPVPPSWAETPLALMAGPMRPNNTRYIHNIWPKSNQSGQGAPRQPLNPMTHQYQTNQSERDYRRSQHGPSTAPLPPSHYEQKYSRSQHCRSTSPRSASVSSIGDSSNQRGRSRAPRLHIV